MNIHNFQTEMSYWLYQMSIHYPSVLEEMSRNTYGIFASAKVYPVTKRNRSEEQVIYTDRNGHRYGYVFDPFCDAFSLTFPDKTGHHRCMVMEISKLVRPTADWKQ